MSFELHSRLPLKRVYLFFHYIYVIYDEPLLLNKAVDTDDFGFLPFLFERALQPLSYIYILQSCRVGKHSNVNSTSWCCNLKRDPYIDDFPPYAEC